MPALAQPLWHRDLDGFVAYDRPIVAEPVDPMVLDLADARRRLRAVPPNNPTPPATDLIALVTAAANAAAERVAAGVPDDRRIEDLTKSAAKSAVAEVFALFNVDLTKVESVDMFRRDMTFTRTLRESFGQLTKHALTVVVGLMVLGIVTAVITVTRTPAPYPQYPTVNPTTGRP